MGILGGLKKELQRQFIARPDESKDTILYKWPDSNIRLLTQLTVQADEKAVFFKEGKVHGTLEAGTHNLDGKDIPFLGALIDAATGGNFLISELYFVSTRHFTNLPFGGMIDNVIDPTTQLAITIRLFGEYAVNVVDPEKLILKLVGTKNLETNEQLTEWFKELLLKVFREAVSDYVAVQNKPVLGIASQASEFEKLVLETVKKEIDEYGIEIPKLGNVTISIKEDDEAMLKQLTRDFAYSKNMGAADAAVKLGMAEGLKSGSSAGQQATSAMGASVGFGMAMGQNIGNQTTQSNTQTNAPATPASPTTPTTNQPTE